MKNKKIIALILISMLVLTSCKNKSNNKDNVSSNYQSSNNSSQMDSSKTDSFFESSSDQELSSSETSSDEETPANAVPIIVDGIDLTKANELDKSEKGWGQGRIVDKGNRPVTCNQYQPKYEEYGALFIMPREEKKMYLTFDEGYENGYTSKILDTLKEKNCPAVFFVTMPYVKGNPDLIKRMIDEGHVVGNHSVHHKSTPTLSIEEQVKEISDLHNYIVENYNYQMTLFRPPMGQWSTQSLYVTNQLGYKTVFWSFAYADWDQKKQIGVEKAFPRVTEAAHNGAIYLLHAVSKDNADMLGDVIDNFREKGYSLEKLQ